AREGEEERQQKDRAEGLETLAQELAQAGVRRYANAGQEGAEQRVDADELRRQCRGEDEGEDNGQETPVAVPPRGGLAYEARCQGFDDEEHDSDEQQGQADRHQRAGNPIGADDRHHDREQAPGGDVVHGRARDGGGAEVRVGKPALLEDARQHRESRDAHGDADEESEGAERHSGRRERRIEDHRRGGAQEERHDDAGVAHHDRRVRLLPQVLHVELDPHHEHEQDDPDLAEQTQGAHGRGGKDEPLYAGGEQTQQGGTEKDACDHLADDGRLAELAKERAESPRGDDDDDDLEQQDAQGALQILEEGGGDAGGRLRRLRSYSRMHRRRGRRGRRGRRRRQLRTVIEKEVDP